MAELTIAVTGMNAGDSPGPGVAVIRAIREGAVEGCRIVGLSYDALDPGNFMPNIADACFLIPYPSQGAQALLERIEYIHSRCPIDVIVPTLDAEMSSFVRLEAQLLEMGIRMFIPSEAQLNMRAKEKLELLDDQYGVQTPKGVAITESSQIYKLAETLNFPVMVKGRFYDAYFANSPTEVDGHFQRLRAQWGLPIIVQEFIVGEEYDVAALGDGKGGVIGAVPMRKMQLTEKGKAWGGVTIADDRLNEFIRDVISKLGWRGPLELEVMKERQSGELYVIEINPRFPAWIYLSAGAKRNLPWATVQLALGKAVPEMAATEPGVMFLRHSYDQICSMSDYESLTTGGEVLREGAQHE